MTEQEYFDKYKELNLLRMDAEKSQDNKYIVYGFEQAILKLQRDYQNELNKKDNKRLK